MTDILKYGILLCSICLFSCKSAITHFESTPILKVEKFVDLLNPNEILEQNTEVSVYYTQSGLRIKANIQESNLQAQFNRRDTTVYLDPCFEILFDPGGDALNYYEFEINALSTVWDLKLKSSKGRINDPSNVVDWHIPESNYSVKLNGTLNNASDIDEGWSVDVLIPWSRIEEGRPQKGDLWHINFMRIDYDENNSPRYWVWKPTGIGMIHKPAAWPKLIF